jgi:hypothetical protein
VVEEKLNPKFAFEFEEERDELEETYTKTFEKVKKAMRTDGMEVILHSFSFFFFFFCLLLLRARY